MVGRDGAPAAPAARTVTAAPAVSRSYASGSVAPSVHSSSTRLSAPSPISRRTSWSCGSCDEGQHPGQPAGAGLPGDDPVGGEQPHRLGHARSSGTAT